MSKKMKIRIIFGIVTTCIIIIACSNIKYSKVNQNKSSCLTLESTEKWKQKAPKLFSNNIGYNKLMVSNNIGASKLSEPKIDLVGTITNPFGIRDDILDYILNTIPESNIRATVSIIKMAYYHQQMVGVTDDKQLNSIANKSMAAIYCANLPISISAKFIDGYDKLIRDTSARNLEWNRIEHQLNNHIISHDFGVDSYDYKEQCDTFLGALND